jgi:hypothetical protein
METPCAPAEAAPALKAAVANIEKSLLWFIPRFEP